jgi:ribose 1,5-bisphosphokinase PhnN
MLLQVGPEGCGKSTLLDYCFSRLPGRVTVATVHCSAQTSADTVIQKLLQVRMTFLYWNHRGAALCFCTAVFGHIWAPASTLLRSHRH